MTQGKQNPLMFFNAKKSTHNNGKLKNKKIHLKDQYMWKDEQIWNQEKEIDIK